GCGTIGHAVSRRTTRKFAPSLAEPAEHVGEVGGLRVGDAVVLRPEEVLVDRLQRDLLHGAPLLLRAHAQRLRLGSGEAEGHRHRCGRYRLRRRGGSGGAGWSSMNGSGVVGSSCGGISVTFGSSMASGGGFLSGGGMGSIGSRMGTA